MATKTGKKTGGRQKGTPNKKTQLQQEAINKAVEEHGDPFEVLLLIAHGKWEELGVNLEPWQKNSLDTLELRRASAEKACKYIHPQKRALEVKTGVEHTHNHKIGPGFYEQMIDYQEKTKQIKNINGEVIPNKGEVDVSSEIQETTQENSTHSENG